MPENNLPERTNGGFCNYNPAPRSQIEVNKPVSNGKMRPLAPEAVTPSLRTLLTVEAQSRMKRRQELNSMHHYPVLSPIDNKKLLVAAEAGFAAL
jgi:hypothetical protein